MTWKSVCTENLVDWLLEEDNPSVRYFALRDILGIPNSDNDVVAAKRAIPDSAVVKRVFKRQRIEGFWEDAVNPYHPKYKSSYWQIMVLGQLGLDRTDSRVRSACEHIFQFQLPEGGFSSSTSQLGRNEYEAKRRKGKTALSVEEYVTSKVREHEYSCLTGNMAAALIRLGCGQDSRVKKALEWLVEVQNSDGGWLCPYWRAHVRDKHGCFYGTICPLEAFSAIGIEELDGRMRETVEKAAEFLLMHRLYKADHHGYRIINKGWLTLGFPFFYGYNILRGLDVLTCLGYVKDERLNDAVQVLLEKRQKDGKWILESTPAGRMQADLEVKGEPSKWVTLIALRVLKRLSTTK